MEMTIEEFTEHLQAFNNKIIGVVNEYHMHCYLDEVNQLVRAFFCNGLTITLNLQPREDGVLLAKFEFSQPVKIGVHNKTVYEWCCYPNHTQGTEIFTRSMIDHDTGVSNYDIEGYASSFKINTLKDIN